MAFKATNVNSITKSHVRESQLQEISANLQEDIETLSIFALTDNLRLQVEKGKTMTEINEIQRKERINIFSFINAVKFLSPVVKSSFMMNTSPEERATFINDKVHEANKFATAMMLDLSLNDEDKKLLWFKNSLERFYMENIIDGLREQAEARGGQNKNDYLVSLKEATLIGKTIIELVQNKIDNEDFADFEIVPIENLKLRFMAKMAEVLLNTSIKLKGQIYKEQTDFLNQVHELLINKSVYFFNLRVEAKSLADQNTRFNFFSSIINDLSSLFIEFYKLEIKELNNNAKANGITLVEYLKRMPDSINVEKVFEKVVAHYSIIFNMAKVIIPRRMK